MTEKRKLRDVSPVRRPLKKSFVQGACAVPLKTTTVCEALTEAANQKPSHVGFIFSETDEELSFAHVLHMSDVYAKSLLALGVRRGDHVAASGFHDSDFVFLMFAAFNIGAVFSTPFLFEPESITMRTSLNKIKCKYFFLSTKGFSNYKNVFSLIPEDETKETSTSALCERIPSLQEAFVLSDEETPKGWRSFDEMRTLGASISDDQLAAAKRSVDPDDPAYIIFSSGSTGEPKAVLWKHQKLVNLGWTFQIRRNPDRKDIRYAMQSPVFEDIFCVVDTISATVCLDINISCVYGSSKAGEIGETWREAEVIERYRCTHSSHYPFVWSRLFAEGCLDKYDLSSLRGGISGSVIMNEEFSKRLLKLMPELVNIYGMAECMNFTMTRPERSELGKRLTTVGTVMPHSEIKIIDDSGRIVPIGREGELCARGWATFIRYVNDPELTSQTKDAAGWLHSGDLCRMDETGHVTYLARKADCIRFKIFGDVVYPGAIEAATLQHPNVKSAKVVSIFDEINCIDGLYICILTENGENVSKEDLQVYYDDSGIACDHRPRQVFLMTRFPLTGLRKKVSRHLLAEEVRNIINRRQGSA